MTLKIPNMLMILFNRIYTFFDKGSLKILCLFMALMVAGYIFWEPELFSLNKGIFVALWQIYFIIWMVCAGLIYGSGIKLNYFIFKVICFPPLIFIVLLFSLIYVGQFIF